tara:strand:+ start:699 stop:1988 length:1290 start_codon:yes stop_codon:yes gene_type:complete
MPQDFKIAFVGLTHLGLNYLVSSASKGYLTIGYHHQKLHLDAIKNYKIDYSEPDLIDKFKKYKKNILLTNDLKEIKKCKLIYISYDVPVNSNNTSDHESIIKIINKVIKVANKNSEIVVLCQVPPGFSKKIRWNKQKLFYQVETLIFGDAVDRAIHPERIIVGCNSKKYFKKSYLAKFLKKYGCTIITMKLISAEITKIAINLYLVSSINTTNMLAEYCEKSGASWSEIVPALRKDKRIGEYAYLKPGVGIGGDNLKRDLETFKQISKKINSNYNLINTWHRNDIIQKKWIFSKINEVLCDIKKEPNFALLGLSYKENTNSTKNSLSIQILKKYRRYKFKIYDPVVELESMNNKHIQVHSLKEAISDSNILILMTPWKEFKDYKNYFDNFSNSYSNYIIDPFRCIDVSVINLNFKKFLGKYYSIGESVY